MANQQLIDYINQSRQKGVTDDYIKQSLLSAGWSEQDIQNAMNTSGGATNTLNTSESTQQIFQIFINKWSWGGFFLYFFYFLGSRNYKRAFLYLIGSAIPILNIYLWIKSGLRGRRLVWESGKWQDFESYQKRQKLLDKIGIFLVVVIIIMLPFILTLLSYTLKYFGFINKKTEISPINQIIQPRDSINQPSDQSNSDIDSVKIILEDIRQGFLTGNVTLIAKHATKETASFILSAKMDPVSSFTVNSVSKIDSNIVANITTVSDGKPDTQDIVFIKEDGDWKFDMKSTLQYEMNKTNTEKNINNSGGLPDLVVISATVYPSRPIVNNKNVEIKITIKNIGTKISDGGAPLVAELVGFKDLIPIKGGDLAPLPPGRTTTWTFRPYDKNDVFKISDVPGQKTIRIVLNEDRKIIESNYDNNVFTQKIQIYSY